MSSEMIGEKPKITEDSDLVDIIRKTYSGKVGRNHKTSEYCVGGALCHYFADEPFNTHFPFVDNLTEELINIIERRGKMDAVLAEADVLDMEEMRETCNYYAGAMINANDSGDYEDAWIHVGMFLEEFGID